MLSMHELSLPEPMLSLSMLILATCPEHTQECSEHCSARSERSEHFWTLGTMFGNTTGLRCRTCEKGQELTLGDLVLRLFSLRRPASPMILARNIHLTGWRRHDTDTLTRRDLTGHGTARTDTDGA